MANINNKNVADTIIKLIRAGKQMPQASKMQGAENPKEMASQILKQTVDLFCEIFLPQKIGLERWKKAETLALTITKADTLNVNLITPALMQTALKLAEQEQLEEARTNYKREKEEELSQSPFDWSEAGMRRHKLIAEWTKLKIAAYSPFDMPNDGQVLAFALQNNMTRKQADDNKLLIKIYLADKSYCDACRSGQKKRCYLRGVCKELVTDNDTVDFRYQRCSRYYQGGI